MIIGRQHSYLFVEVPNTGSTAIAAELTQFYGGERLLHKHATVAEFLRTPEGRSNTYFIFSTIRNPLDATLTQYFKMRSNHRGRFTAERLRGTPSVTPRHLELFEYVQAGGDFAGFFRRLQTGVYSNHYLLLAERMNYVMRYERLQDDFATVLQHLNLTQVRAIPDVNVTAGKSGNYWDYYTKEVRDRAITAYWPYMKRWGYAFPAEWGTPRTQPIAELKFLSTHLVATSMAMALGVGPNSRRPWLVSARDLLRRYWS
jgi:hypothetical protein